VRAVRSSSEEAGAHPGHRSNGAAGAGQASARARGGRRGTFWAAYWLERAMTTDVPALVAAGLAGASIPPSSRFRLAGAQLVAELAALLLLLAFLTVWTNRWRQPAINAVVEHDSVSRLGLRLRSETAARSTARARELRSWPPWVATSSAGLRRRSVRRSGVSSSGYSSEPSSRFPWS